MSRFTILVTPDGRAVLTSEEEMTQDQMVMLRRAWDRWRGDPPNALILSGARVVQVKEIDLDLAEGGGHGESHTASPQEATRDHSRPLYEHGLSVDHAHHAQDR